MINSPENLSQLTRRLGVTFENTPLLLRALTHRSMGAHNNERLEFLGDSILNFIIGSHVFERFPGASEGELTRIRARLVCEEKLAQLATHFELNRHLILGAGEQKGGGAHRASILADALEAIIGALYIELGIVACRERVLAWYQADFKNILSEVIKKDAKTRLQEYLQAKKLPLPVYDVEAIFGDPHAPTFKVSCTIEVLTLVATAEAASRRKAEQAAAEAILRQLGVY